MARCIGNFSTSTCRWLLNGIIEVVYIIIMKSTYNIITRDRLVITILTGAKAKFTVK